MDNDEHDGLGRSSAIGHEYASSGHSYETYMPTNVGNVARDISTAIPAPPIKVARQARDRSRVKTDKNGAAAPIVGSSAAAVKLRELIALYADCDAPVLITGETGVGKELVARQLHALSRRAEAAFAPLNIAAIPESLAASELFGHARGAFTGAVAEHEGAIAQADGGVLFLDEIGDMPLSVQTHLLRVLEDGMVTKVGGKSAFRADFRLITATNIPLREQVSADRFRQDLYYRVNVLAIDVPPLRARGDDVIEIAESMLAGPARDVRPGMQLTPKAADRLRGYGFPGNIRELRNILSRAAVHARGDDILPEHIQFDRAECGGRADREAFDIDDAKNLVGRFIMMKALYACGGNVTKAASLTGRSRGTLHNLKKSIEGEDFTSAFHSACTQMKALLEGC